MVFISVVLNQEVYIGEFNRTLDSPRNSYPKNYKDRLFYYFEYDISVIRVDQLKEVAVEHIGV